MKEEILLERVSWVTESRLPVLEVLIVSCPFLKCVEIPCQFHQNGIRKSLCFDKQESSCNFQPVYFDPSLCKLCSLAAVSHFFLWHLCSQQIQKSPLTLCFTEIFYYFFFLLRISVSFINPAVLLHNYSKSSQFFLKLIVDTVLYNKTSAYLSDKNPF